MRRFWITADELAAVLKVSVKSIRRAYRKGEIPVDRFCRFVRFDLERVKEACRPNGHGRRLCLSQEEEGTAQRDRRRQPAARAADPPPTW
jgi:excisionase family DNA binding protein